MLDRLEAKGLVRRARCPKDRRVVRLELTDEGQRLCREIPYNLSRVLTRCCAASPPRKSRRSRGSPGACWQTPRRADPSPSARHSSMFDMKSERRCATSCDSRRRSPVAGCWRHARASITRRSPRPPIDAATLGAKPAAIEWPREDWWRRYGDAQLDALIADGLAGAPTLAAARARIAAREAAAGVARAALLPGGLRQCEFAVPALFGELHLSAAARRQLEDRQPADARLQLRDRFLEQERRGARGRAVAGAGRRRRRADRARRADDATSRARISTCSASSRSARCRAPRSRSAKKSCRLTAQRFDAGLDTKVEAKQAEAALGTVRTELAQYDEAIAVARIQIAALVGAGPERGDSARRGRAGARAGDGAAGRRSRSTSSRAGRRSSRRAGASKRRGKDIDVARAHVLPERQPGRVRRALVDRLVEPLRGRQRDRRRGPGDPLADLRRRAPQRQSARPRGRLGARREHVQPGGHRCGPRVAEALVVDRRLGAHQRPSRRAPARRRPTPTTSPSSATRRGSATT